MRKAEGLKPRFRQYRRKAAPVFKIDRYTFYGLTAILLWSTTIAFARSVSEQVGAIGAAAAVYLIGGVVCLASLAGKKQSLRRLRQLPPLYLYGCGALFIVYMLALFLAVGLAHDRRQALEIGLLNYLWPSFTILGALVFLKKKGNLLLLPGTFLALGGVFLVLTQSASISWSSFLRNVVDNPPAYLLAMTAAVVWALYSNLARRWAGSQTANGVTLFIPATGLILLLIYLASPSAGSWTLRSGAEALFLALATVAGYLLWDTAMRKGDMVLVAAFSYLTPFFSTLVSCFYLHIIPAISLWIGCGLIIGGSFLSWLSVSELAAPVK